MNIKKYLSLFLMLVLSISFNTTVFSEENYVYTETENTSFKENMSLMKGLGIIEEKTNFQISDTITRGEFSKLIVNLFNYGDMAKTTTYADKFCDVYADTPNMQFILTATSLGFLNGYNNDTFKHNEYVTVSQAVKSIVTALGYGDIAQKDGGYPRGYINKARNLKILTDSNASYSITFGSLISMIEKSLEVELMECTSKELPKYEILKGQNILTNYHKLYKKIGIVNGTHKTHIVKNEHLPYGKIEINDNIYDVATDYSDFIGMKAIYYVNESNDKIKYLFSKNNYNDIFTLDAKYIESYANGIYRYTKTQTDKIFEKKISDNVYVIYNGRALSKYTDMDLFPKVGEVKFIDNNHDGNTDVLMIFDCKIMIVAQIDNENMELTDKINSKYILNLFVNDSDKQVSIKTLDEKDLPFDKIKKWDILSIAQSKDNMVIDVFVSKNVIKGTVSGFSNGAKSTQETIIFNNEEFSIYKDTFNKKDAVLGKMGNLYLDNKGNAVYFRENTNENKNIGFIIDAMKEKGISETVKVKIFNDLGKIEILDTIENLKVDMKTFKNATDILDALKKDGSEILSQIIVYELNENGKISSINTAYNLKADNNDDYLTKQVPNEENDNSLRILYSSKISGNSKLTYKSSSKIFSGKVGISNSSKIFRIPNDPKNADEDKFDVLSTNYFYNDESYLVEGYSYSSNNLLSDILILYEDSSAGEVGNSVGLVKKVSKGIDEQRDEIYKVKVLTIDGIRDLYCDKSEFVKNVAAYDSADEKVYEIAQGDTIKFGADYSGKLYYIRLLYDESDITNPVKFNNPTGEHIGYHRFIFANVYLKENNAIGVTLKNETQMATKLTPKDYELFSTQYFRLMQYDKNDGANPVKFSSISSVYDYINNNIKYSKVLIHTSHGEGFEIIIYE